MSKSRAICLVCTGSSCSKKKDALERLKRSLDGEVHLVPVKCQKICKGPVLGAHVGGRLEWFSKLRKNKDCKAFRELVRQGVIDDDLARRREKKRSGRLRK